MNQFVNYNTFTAEEKRKIARQAAANHRADRAWAMKYRINEQKKLEEKRREALEAEKDPKQKNEIRNIMRMEKKENRMMNRMARGILRNEKKMIVAERKRALGIPLSKREEADYQKYGARKAQLMADMAHQAKIWAKTSETYLANAENMPFMTDERKAFYADRLRHLQEMGRDPIAVAKEHFSPEEEARFHSAHDIKDQQWDERRGREAEWRAEAAKQNMEAQIAREEAAGTLARRPLSQEELQEFKEALKTSDLTKGEQKGRYDLAVSISEEGKSKREAEARREKYGHADYREHYKMQADAQAQVRRFVSESDKKTLECKEEATPSRVKGDDDLVR